MNLKKINTILLTEESIYHIIYSQKKEEFIIENIFQYSINPFDKFSMDNALKQISQIVKNDKLTKLNIINDNVLKYQFYINQNENSNIRLEVLNRFKTTFDIKLNDYYIDYEIYNFKNTNIVFIAGINKTFLDSILKKFKSLKFKLLLLEVDIIALKRLVSLKFNKEITMHIHLRNNKTIFLVTFKNMLLAFRELNFGFQSIIEQLSEETKLKENTLLNQLNFDELPVAKALDRFTIELQRTIDFYNTQFRNEPVKKFVLTGNFLNIKGIESYLSQLFLVETKNFNPFEYFTLHLSNKLIKNTEYIPELLGTCLREI